MPYAAARFLALRMPTRMMISDIGTGPKCAVFERKREREKWVICLI